MPRRYQCCRVAKGIVIDGSLSDPGWSGAEWSDDFVDITGDPKRAPRFRTRVKMAWDDEFLYVGADLEEPHVWGTITERNAVMFEDNDFEVFIDPDGDGLDYYEFEINALGSIIIRVVIDIGVEVLSGVNLSVCVGVMTALELATPAPLEEFSC